VTYLIDRGIQFQVAAGSIPGQQQQSSPPGRICFDSIYSAPYAIGRFTNTIEKRFGLKTKDIFSRRFADGVGTTDRANRPISHHDKCDDPQTNWIEPFIRSQGTGPPSQPAPQRPPAGRDTTADGNQPAAKRPGANAAANGNQPTAKETNANTKPMYEIYDEQSDSIIQIYFRSTWGIYQFLGDLIRRQETFGLPFKTLFPAFQSDTDLFRVVNDGSTYCFASVAYAGMIHCVPTDAYNAKMVMSLLHEIANLYTRPNNTQQPNTSTARITP
jgi:hypothetical protein